MSITKKNLNAEAAKAQQIFYSGSKQEALEYMVLLRGKYPEEDLLKNMLAYFAGEAGNDVPVSEDFANELVACLDEGCGDVRRLLVAAGPVLGANDAFIGALAMFSTGNPDANRNMLLRGWLDPVLKNRLFLSLMRNVILTNREYELALTKLRKLVLLTLSSDADDSELIKMVGLEFCSSLAMQGQLNEYVYFVDEEERERLEDLYNVVKEELTETSEVSSRLEKLLLVFSMYQPLQQLNIEENRWNPDEYVWPLSLFPLVRCVSEYYREQEIKKQIQEIGIVEDCVSTAVKEQYEENPYPRWTSLPASQKDMIGCWISGGHPGFDTPEFLNRPVRLFVAGCGTGRDLLWLHSSWETSQVLAVDLSRSSLAYAIRKAKELGVAGAIKFRQADILWLEALPDEYKDFDVIVCSGVLHHMKEPLRGWQILVDLLRPGGVMKIGLYSELARKLVVKAREAIGKSNIPSSLDGIRGFRRDILSGKYPELLGLRTNTDMFSISMCRDLLFHVQEWRFTIKKIQECLEKLNLAFIGFEGIEESKELYKRIYPEDINLNNLKNWSEFERRYPDTFESMYNIIVQKH
ncbi:MAG: class I SAM-dependent methyltransferase [Deltaproteobacteria bacterium]|nr:class I SAM-dependent methyltransferase [Deltaproteobacteria bacterium]